MVRRLSKPLESDSFFMFGARGTGKSTFVAEFLRSKSSFCIDLLDFDSEEKYARDPQLLEREVQAFDPPAEWILIDEIQKVPKLLARYCPQAY